MAHKASPLKGGIMSRLAVWGAVLVCLFVFIGCATPQVVILKNGNKIETRDKLDFDITTGFYRYESADGVKGQINKDEIVEIKDKK